MANYVRISEELKIKCNKQVKEYLSADYVYIPYHKEDKLIVTDGQEVFKNDVILTNDNGYVYSPISGNIIGVCDSIVDGAKQKTIVIENNFKEQTKKVHFAKKKISDYSNDEIKDILKTHNVYNGLLKGKTLIINGIDLEPYDETYSYLIKEHTDDILEAVHVLIKILNIHKCFFAIKNNDSDNVETLVNQIGTYPNIDLRLLPDEYPIGHKDILIKELVMESKLKKGVIVLSVQDVYNIYNCLKRNTPITEKLVTITGDALNKTKVMDVKIGTRLADILNDEFKIINDKYHIFINGLLSGYEVNSLNTIITSNINSVYINTKKEFKPNKCINCGLCHLNCPVGADSRTGYKMDKCIKCGLCNYVCPSKRNVVGDKYE